MRKTIPAVVVGALLACVVAIIFFLGPNETTTVQTLKALDASFNQQLSTLDARATRLEMAHAALLKAKPEVGALWHDGSLDENRLDALEEAVSLMVARVDALEFSVRVDALEIGRHGASEDHDVFDPSVRNDESTSAIQWAALRQRFQEGPADWGRTARVDARVRAELVSIPLGRLVDLVSIECRSTGCGVSWRYDTSSATSKELFELENDVAAALGAAGLTHSYIGMNARGDVEALFFTDSNTSGMRE